jgi:hypothetical protein
MVVERYDPGRHQPEWDAFVRASKNGTFLLTRGYMDYHADRFADHSLLVRDPERRLVAVMPAHATEGGIESHGGLSYGGLVTGPEMKLPVLLRVFEAAAGCLVANGFRTWGYKTIPHIYHRHPAEEDRYALFLMGAQAVRRDLLLVVPADDRLPFQTRRERGTKKARTAGVEVQEQPTFADYWPLLTETLAERFAASPVHSLEEITALRERFPGNIRLFTATLAEAGAQRGRPASPRCASASAGGPHVLAGVIIYESDRVAHCQYIAASSEGRAVGALDLLFDHLLNVVYRDIPYFDFGSSHEDGGRAVNLGLIEQKEGFGARSVVHEHYSIDLTTFRAGALTEALR